MARAERVNSTTVNTYATTTDASARLWWVTSENATQPTGEQIEAGVDADGNAGVHAGSQPVEAGETAAIVQTGLDPTKTYTTHFVQNLSEYKGFLHSFAGGSLGDFTFTRVGTQDGVGHDGNPYTAAENEPAYVLDTGDGILLQEDTFDANGETFLSIALATAGLNSQLNEYSGQIIFTSRTDMAGIAGKAFIHITAPGWGNTIYQSTSGTGSTTYTGRSAGGVAAFTEQYPTNNIVAGDRLDLRFRVSATTGISMWSNGAKANNAGATLNMAELPTTIMVGAGWNNSEQKANLTVEFVRVVDAALSDAEIGGW